ncbi:RuBisCO large subunit C-terminal-like domain-containing protein [Wenzhouxiangella sp. EGI_FJ10409]|uniref:RuBisCO large subunit C-terminal-like domain-containing protein n=1 Tax=Wenzhouxiangella sp. EGI_FJ10409 TaxID=3243767 RepID=UPI0035D8412F
MTPNLIEATYVATSPDRDAETLAENIAREQSLEIVPELIPTEIRERLLGRVLGVEQLDEERWALNIGYPEALASRQIGQLLHLLYGNISFYPRIRLTAVRLPESLLAELPGPLGGIERIRRITGVHERAMLMTVLKPRGSSPEHLADLALRFARGGGDLVKDDQNLVETEISSFTKRIRKCAQSIEKASEITGRRCLYLPHAAGSGDHLKRQLEAVAEAGLHGVVLCPWVMGLETAATAARDFDLMWLAHPALAGSLTEPEDRGVETDVLLGTMTRVAGADISIFPGSGGRISASHDDEAATCRALTAPLGNMKTTLPCIGGGKRIDQVAQAGQKLGPDYAVLVGGDLLRQGESLEAATRHAIDSLG